METSLRPVVDELSRLTGDVETVRAAADRETIEHLRDEVVALRRAVAHLRVSHLPVPEPLRPVVARAMVEAS
ncbi:hypothetical protein [Pseudonocardia sp. N23]|uniref:hypothetical protein n=1 Tax=Pseudonocardia sp. N23 TaxID=1987376 RepID=UPI000C0298FD|nr:hypothetical protein [Pseudonocardia sp. N23]GAY11491.1 hypothetical protein TOK_6001 [Pseudonocardia sp. N23]